MREAALRRASWHQAQANPKRLAPAKLERPAPDPGPGYALLSAVVYRDSRLSCTALRLLQQMVQWARGRGSCDAYVEQIADILGVSVRTVQRAQRRAELCGYIRVIHRREGRTNDANVYELTALAVPPAKAPAQRTTSRRRSKPYGVTLMPPHEERAKALSPLNPPKGRKMSDPQGVRAGSALRRGGLSPLGVASPSAGVADITAARRKRLSGGAAAKSDPKTRPPDG